MKGQKLVVWILCSFICIFLSAETCFGYQQGTQTVSETPVREVHTGFKQIESFEAFDENQLDSKWKNIEYYTWDEKDFHYKNETPGIFGGIELEGDSYVLLENTKPEKINELQLQDQTFFLDENGRLYREFLKGNSPESLQGYTMDDVFYKDGHYYFYSKPQEEPLVIQSEGKEYYLKEDGTLAVDEFIPINNRTYYFGEDGTKKVNTIIMKNEQPVYLDMDGSVVDKNTYKARQYAMLVIDQVGRDPAALFAWTVNHLWYRAEGYTRPVQDFAVIGFETGSGNCFCFAGVFYFLADTAGYDARFVQSSVTYRNGNGGAHGWVLIREGDKEYAYDASAHNELGHLASFYRIDPNYPPVRYVYPAGQEPLGGYTLPW